MNLAVCIISGVNQVGNREGVMHLFTVRDSFQIEGRGCIIIPGISEDESGIKKGDKIVLRTPAGAEINTHIEHLENIRVHPRPEKLYFPICLPPNLSKENVPPGTEVFFMKKSN